MLKQLINSNDYIPQTMGAGTNAVTSKIPGVNAVTGAVGGGFVYSATQLGSMLGQDEYEPVERKEVQSELPQLNDYMGEESKSNPSYDTTPLSYEENTGNSNYDEVEQVSNNDQLENISDHVNDSEETGSVGSDERVPTETRTNGSELEDSNYNRGSDDLPSLDDYIEDDNNSQTNMESLPNESEELSRPEDNEDRESITDEFKGEKGDIRDKAENAVITETTGVEGGKLKEFEARYNEKFRDNPVHNKLREGAGTDWENKGYGNSDDDDESHEEIKRDDDSFEEIKRDDDDSFEEIKRDEDRLDDESEEN